LSVKSTPDVADTEAILSKANAAAGGSDSEILITDATGGVLEVYFVPEDTQGENGDYWYDLVVENASGRRLQAIEPSRFSIKETITQLS
jgi:hypothetical protein